MGEDHIRKKIENYREYMLHLMLTLNISIFINLKQKLCQKVLKYKRIDGSFTLSYPLYKYE